MTDNESQRPGDDAQDAAQDHPRTEQPAQPEAPAPPPAHEAPADSSHGSPASPAPVPPPAVPPASETHPAHAEDREPTRSLPREESEPTRALGREPRSGTAVPPPPPAGTSQFPESPPGPDRPSPHAHAAPAPVAPPTDRRRPARQRTGLILVAALLLGLLGGVGGAALYGYLDDEFGSEDGPFGLGGSREAVELEPGTIERVAEEVLPSVVQLTVGAGLDAGSGTGVILSEDGQILTNHHVVAGAVDGNGDIVVSFSDGTRTDAEILGSDSTSDLAVVQAQDVSGLTPAVLGSSEDLAVGQQVVAIGSPFGLESTVTTGIVSALNRPVNVPASGAGDDGTIFSALQTDAAINPGNSGGPLVDLAGQVVGINSAIRTDSGRAGSIGLGFAIPVDVAKRIAEVLARGEEAEHARIGITVSNDFSDNELVTTGASVEAIEAGSPGEEAGLAEGDIITGINQLPVISADALVAGIRLFEPGTVVELTILRDDESQTVEVRLGSDADFPEDPEPEE